MRWVEYREPVHFVRLNCPWLENDVPSAQIPLMWKSDIICPECGAGYRRIELASVKGAKGEYRCLTFNQLLEVFDGTFEVLIRLTVPPVKAAQ
jgi:hypothetical protein